MTPGQKESAEFLFRPLVLLPVLFSRLRAFSSVPTGLRNLLALLDTATLVKCTSVCLGQWWSNSPGPRFHSNMSLTSLCRTEGVHWARGLGREPFPERLLAKAGQWAGLGSVLLPSLSSTASHLHRPHSQAVARGMC